MSLDLSYECVNASAPSDLLPKTITKMQGASVGLPATNIAEVDRGGKKRKEPVKNKIKSISREYVNFYCEEDLHDEALQPGMHKCRWSSCNLMFVESDDLVNHVNDDHVKIERDNDFTCRWENCSRNGKAFNARYKMLIHVRTHTHEKPHLCGLCGKPFSRLENLKIHNRSHTGEKPYVCTVNGCYKKYSNSSDRFKHIRTHFEDKPYVCRKDGCDKKYTDPSSLRKHMKTYGHNREGTTSTSNGGKKDKVCILKNPTNSQGTQANGVKLLSIPVLADSSLENPVVVSQKVPALPMGVTSLIFNPMFSTALTLSGESAKYVRGYVNDDGIIPSPMGADSTVSSAMDAMRGQVGPLDLTVN